MRSSILARILGFRQRIIPEPRVPSRGSQAQGTRLPARYVTGNTFVPFMLKQTNMVTRALGQNAIESKSKASMRVINLKTA